MDMKPTTSGDGTNTLDASVLLLGVSFDSGNMGVGALGASAVQLLTRRFGDRSIALLDYRKATNDTFTVRVDGGSATIGRINLRFSWKAFLPNNVFSLIVLALLSRIPGCRQLVVSRNSTLRL